MGREDMVLGKAAEDEEAGLQALRAGELEKAVQLLGRALEKKVQVYGEVAPECAHLYFKYGTALLYKSQEEAEVIGNSRAAAAAGETSVVATSLPGSNGSDAGPKEQPAEPAPAVKDRKGKSPVVEEATEDDEGEEEDDEDGSGGEEEDLEEAAEEAGEEEGDLALAWQVLETARCIYEKMPARSLDEVDVIMTLADISLEKEDFGSCITDYQNAMWLLQSMVPPHSRRIAEAYFRLCLAHQTANQPSEALTACRNAIEACLLNAQRIKSLLNENKASKSHGIDQGGNSTAKGSASGVAHDASDAATRVAAAGSAEAALEVGSTQLEGAGCSTRQSDLSINFKDTCQELEEVEAVIVELKEKESELKDVLSHPSLKHLLAAMQEKQGASGSNANAKEDTSSSQPPKSGGLVADFCGGTAKSLAKAKEMISDSGPAAGEPVAVVGRGKKRVAPTPVDPTSEDLVKRLC